MVPVLFEDEYWQQLLPLVYLRPVWELRCGARTIDQKWRRHDPQQARFLARSYIEDGCLLDNARLSQLPPETEILLINGRWLPPAKAGTLLAELDHGQARVCGNTLLAMRTTAAVAQQYRQPSGALNSAALMENSSPDAFDARLINYPWDAVAYNGEEIVTDFLQAGVGGDISGTVYDGATLLQREAIHVAEDALIKPGVVMDAERGPLWIDRGAKVMPNAVLEGPLYVGERSTIKIGAKIYEQTSIGPVCKVGGEVEGSIFQSYSNKQHDGFLGHAYLGSWVNLGADTNNSDLKNNYGMVTVLLNGKPLNTGKMFVGLIMGDHSKCAINTMFNTGTIVGLSCNIFGAGMPPKFVPSFSWGGADGLETYDFERARALAATVMARRNIRFTESDAQLFATARELANQIETQPHKS